MCSLELEFSRLVSHGRFEYEDTNEDVSTFLSGADPSSLVVTSLIVPAARDQVIMGDRSTVFLRERHQSSASSLLRLTIQFRGTEVNKVTELKVNFNLSNCNFS